jgi:hypothetical protein
MNTHLRGLTATARNRVPLFATSFAGTDELDCGDNTEERKPAPVTLARVRWLERPLPPEDNDGHTRSNRAPQA